MGDWLGLPIVIAAIAGGLLLLGLSGVYCALFKREEAPLILIGLMSAMQVLVSFTSAKVCGLDIAGFEFFIIAGSLIYPLLECGDDYINEFYGRTYAKTSVHAQVLSRIVTTVFLTGLIFIPSPSGEEANYEAFSSLMLALPRIALASIIASYIGGMVNVHVFAYIKDYFIGRHIWLRTAASTIVSSILNSIVFTAIAFAWLRPIDQIAQMVAIAAAS
jgi:uncharacterized integral membrane protein (TIGR00697 family)